MKKVIKTTLSNDQMQTIVGGGKAAVNFVKVKAKEILEVAAPAILS